MFQSKFQRKTEWIETRLEDVMNFLISHFMLKTWRVLDKNDDQIIFEKEGNKIFVGIESEFNNEKLDEKIDRLVKENNTNFVCLSEQIKNFVIQRAAKYFFDKKLSNLVLFVATIDELKQGKDFKRIAFQA